ncbi:hypothetical protein QBC37DRAFT_55323 [Rhypophila decipiens]|uniref:Uncharacterized protein n=1 Tax=Rhypophila decipiens TaxID=261697 RepID=A0AAN6XYL6_9PEZI|nr:hypothetical protein QBC37DRAFT_55323 [Rhypophila decipiens]
MSFCPPVFSPCNETRKLSPALTSLLLLEMLASVSQHLHLDRVICKAVKKDKNYSTFLIDKTGPELEQAELYTALMSSEWSENIAISSTHFPQSKLTCSLYGCNAKQVERVKLLLASSPEVKGHLMLMGGVFAELQRERLEGLVLETENQLDKLLYT